ncbi:MAG: AI-2E family transporter [Rhodanobacter sp.]
MSDPESLVPATASVAAPADTAAAASVESGEAPAPLRLPSRVGSSHVARQVKHGLRATRGVRRHLRSIRVVLNAFLLLALLYTIALTQALLIPLVLAAFIGLALNPVVAAGARHHLPRWLVASVLMLGLMGAIGTGISLVAQPAVGWFQGAPKAIKTLMPKLKGITEPFEAANRATQTLVNGAPTRARARAAAPPTVAAFTAWDALAKAPTILISVLTVVLLVFFFLIYGDSLLRRLVEIVPDFRSKRSAVGVVRSIQTEVSRYILTTAMINFCLGALTAAMLWFLHMPDPLLWGTVAMLANFIPYVGAITTTGVLTLVGLIHFNTLGAAITPALCFIFFTVMEGNLITPMVLGQRMRISPIAILIWLLIWGWLWGIPGVLLAVPMLTCVKIISENVNGWTWFALLVQR